MCCFSAVKLILDRLIKTDKLWLVDEKKSDGYASLHLACLNNYVEIVQLFVEIVPGLDVNIVNLNQQTPLHMAVERKHLSIINLLMKSATCKVNMQDKDGNAPLHYLLRNLSYQQLKTNSNSGTKKKDNTGGTTNLIEQVASLDLNGEKSDKTDSTDLIENVASLDLNDEKNSINADWKLACCLVDHEANLFLKNKKNETALDLSVNLHFNKMLTEYYVTHLNKKSISSGNEPPPLSSSSSLDISLGNSPSSAENIANIKTQQQLLEECLICTENKRSVLLKPCNHVVACNVCSSHIKKCLICKEVIVQRIDIEECLICSDKKANVLFNPCGHMIACCDCSKLNLKKCIKCRMNIERQVSFMECCGAAPPIQATPGYLNNGCIDMQQQDKLNDMKKLRKQLQDIKEQVIFNERIYSRHPQQKKRSETYPNYCLAPKNQIKFGSIRSF